MKGAFIAAVGISLNTLAIAQTGISGTDIANAHRGAIDGNASDPALSTGQLALKEVTNDTALPDNNTANPVQTGNVAATQTPQPSGENVAVQTATTVLSASVPMEANGPPTPAPAPSQPLGTRTPVQPAATLTGVFVPGPSGEPVLATLGPNGKPTPVEVNGTPLGLGPLLNGTSPLGNLTGTAAGSGYPSGSPQTPKTPPTGTQPIVPALGQATSTRQVGLASIGLGLCVALFLTM